MKEQDDKKIRLRSYSKVKNQLDYHRSWYIYSSSYRLGQPFTLEELQEDIYSRIGIRPRKKNLLQEVHSFYNDHEIALIQRIEPNSDSFRVNNEIDLDRDSYRSLIRPPGEYVGRPRKKYIQTDHELDT